MTERKWTPGPWRFELVEYKDMMVPDLDPDCAEWNIYANDGNDYPIMESKPYYPVQSDNIHDAHLIAAAPDLYEALDMAMREMAVNGYRDDDGPMPKIFAALAKARGETQ